MKWLPLLLFTATLVICPHYLSAEVSLSGPQQDAVEWVDANRADIEQAAEYIYQQAELALREYKSSEYLAGMLETDGFSVERGVAGMPTAFVATYGDGYPVIGILAEYDALPGLSQKPALPRHEAVEPGESGHGCGHNLFGAGSTAAAMAMKDAMIKNTLTGTVKLFGCPAEETLVGKAYMAREGVFDGLDACLNWHPSGSNSVSLAGTNAMNNFEISFKGKTAHGAGDPWNGRSALDAVELMNAGVNYLREHVNPTVRIHYVIPDGGLAPNVVPDYANVWYFVRDTTREGVDDVYERVLNCAKGAALMTGTTMEVNLITGVYPYLPNHAVSAIVDKNLRLIGPPEFSAADKAFAKEMQKSLGIEEKELPSDIREFKDTGRHSAASTDAADVSWIVPTSGQFNVVSTVPGIPWHSWAVAACVSSDIGKKAVITAAKVLAASGINMITNTTIIEEAQKEFREKTEGKPYKSVIPAGQKPPLPGE